MQRRTIKLITLSILIVIYVITYFTDEDRGQNIKRPAMSGHRGTPTIAPENTMASIDSAIYYGIEYIECDVYMSADSIFYLLHDRTLDRTTNGEGAISETHSSYIDSLDAGLWYGEEFKGLRVPRLREVFRRAKEGNVKITIDYRDGDLQKLYDLILEEDALSISTFVMREEHYFAFKKIAPEVNTMQAYIANEASMVADVEKWQPDIAVVWMDSLNQRMVDWLHNEGIVVLGLSLKGEDPDTLGYAKAFKLGVDVLATDRPEYYAKKYAMSTTK